MDTAFVGDEDENEEKEPMDAVLTPEDEAKKEDDAKHDNLGIAKCGHDTAPKYCLGTYCITQ